MKTDNELIAEFMGYKFEQDRNRRITWPKGKGFFKTGYYLETFKYNESWDWLMPVVEKIESLGFRTGINYSTVNNLHGATIYNWQADFKDTSTESKIGITYKVIVEFIKWYNQQSNG